MGRRFLSTILSSVLLLVFQTPEGWKPHGSIKKLDVVLRQSLETQNQNSKRKLET